MVASKGRLKRCLLDLPPEELLPWAELRFGDSCCSTLECMHQAKTAVEKECAACASLLDLPDAAIRDSADGDEELAETMIERRARLLEKLKERGVEVSIRKKI